MILRLLLVALICTSFQGRRVDDGLMQWEPGRRLTWDDFQALPPKDAKNAALTSSSILMKFGTNGKSLKYEISCNFDKKASWGRIRNDHILAHEQGHFDISEIAARKLNRALKEYHVHGNDVSRDVNAIYQRQMDALWEMQMQYDNETDYSRNREQQTAWQIKIESRLKEMEEHTDYR